MIVLETVRKRTWKEEVVEYEDACVDDAGGIGSGGLGQRWPTLNS